MVDGWPQRLRPISWRAFAAQLKPCPSTSETTLRWLVLGQVHRSFVSLRMTIVRGSGGNCRSLTSFGMAILIDGGGCPQRLRPPFDKLRAGSEEPLFHGGSGIGLVGDESEDCLRVAGGGYRQGFFFVDHVPQRPGQVREGERFLQEGFAFVRVLACTELSWV